MSNRKHRVGQGGIEKTATDHGKIGSWGQADKVHLDFIKYLSYSSHQEFLEYTISRSVISLLASSGRNDTMLHKLNELAQNRLILFGISAVFVVIVGIVDYVTGYEMSFSIFYLIPISLCAWYGRGLFAVYSFCIVSAATWLAVEVSSGHQYSHAMMPLWNAAVHIGFFIVTASLLSRLHRVLEAQSSLAQKDGLTGIMNSRTFAQKYHAVAKFSAQQGHSIAVGFIDLDGFKRVNDTLGHNVGDQVLKAVALTISQRVRVSDSSARLGGDEFGLLIPNTDMEGARILFSALRASLLALAANNGWPIGFSIGVAVFHQPPETSDEAIRIADHLMYKVKSAGKNNILFEKYDILPPSV